MSCWCINHVYIKNHQGNQVLEGDKLPQPWFQKFTQEGWCLTLHVPSISLLGTLALVPLLLTACHGVKHLLDFLALRVEHLALWKRRFLTSHRMRSVWYIYLHLYYKDQHLIYVGQYISPMDPNGFGHLPFSIQYFHIRFPRCTTVTCKTSSRPL